MSEVGHVVEIKIDQSTRPGIFGKLFGRQREVFTAYCTCRWIGSHSRVYGRARDQKIAHLTTVVHLEKMRIKNET